jgi:hypothetical protein
MYVRQLDGMVIMKHDNSCLHRAMQLKNIKTSSVAMQLP